MLNSTITFEGNLTDTPTLSFTTHTGTPVTEAVVLVNRRTKDGDQWVDAEPTRHRIKAFRRLAENISTLPKGATVLVTGRIETGTWTDPTTQTKRTGDTVIVEALGASLTFATVDITKNIPATRDEVRADV
ncbi:MAG: single-stranded DNA-binding protein [Aeromicrobium sp.]|nr:single-stranded DNA-binding protein [Aeromicrobium sp.]